MNSNYYSSPEWNARADRWKKPMARMAQRYNKTAPAITESGSVYILTLGYTIVYVGKTDSPRSRLLQHTNDKDFDGFFMIYQPLVTSQCLAEAIWISSFQPIFNKHIPSQKEIDELFKRDGFIRQKCGISDSFYPFGFASYKDMREYRLEVLTEISSSRLAKSPTQ